MGKIYRIFVQEKGVELVREVAGKVLSQVIIDEDTQEQFEAKVIISDVCEDGYSELLIQERGGYIEGKWYVKIVERKEEAEEITVFESLKLGDRRGYMLRSMMAGEKEKMKKELMTEELEKRWKQKREIVDKVLKKVENKE